MKARWLLGGVVAAALTTMGWGCGGGGGDTGGSGSGGGIPCGDHVCSGGTFCTWHYDSCGKADVDCQECSSEPAMCGADARPVCACNGKVYATYCDAVAEGPVGEKGGCANTPAGMFGCGSS